VDPMMISHGVEIPMTEGVEKMVHTLTTVTKSPLFRLFTPTTLFLVSHNSSRSVL